MTGPTRSARRALAAAVAALAALAPTSCSREPGVATPLADPPGFEDSPAASSTTTSDLVDRATAPVAAYRAWLSALADQDAAAACAQHAPQLTIDLRNEAILLRRARLGDPCVDFVAVLWEQPDREYDVLGIEATQVTDEDALLAVDFADQDQTVRMIRQDTRWLVEESVPRTGSADRGPRATERPAAASSPDRWLDVWCDLDLAMTPAELTASMGEPSGTYTIGDGGEPQLYWTQDQYDFRAYLDTDPPRGRAIDLVGDYDRLAAAERDALTCPELR